MNLKPREIQRKKVIEVGSMDVNGSLRPLLESYKPRLYVGVDIKEGKGVDVICNAEVLLKRSERNIFDVAISTELFEHVRDWKEVVSNLKNVVKPEGIILVTTRSYGYPYHGAPFDFWRFELEDMENIFSDCIIEKLEKDPEKGVFIKVRKPTNFVERDLSDFEFYSMICNRRIKHLTEKDLARFIQNRERASLIKRSIKQLLYSFFRNFIRN